MSLKTAVPFTSLFVLLLTACSNSLPVVPINVSVDFSKSNSSFINNIKQLELSKQTNEPIYIADLGNGKVTSGSVFVKLNFVNYLPETKAFGVKSSTPGYPANTRTNIQLLRFYLVNSNAANLTNSNLKTAAFDISSSSTGSLGALFTTLKAGNTGTLKIINVDSGTYYAAVAAYSSSTTINSTTNITNLSSVPAGSSTNILLSDPLDLGRFALSNSGGDSPALNGVVTVGSDLTLTNGGTAPLGLGLSLRDVLGANIDTDVIVNNGSPVLSAVTAQ